ncbi:MAG TPA: response regulator transcription factor [Pseudonocardia sp.]|jgi:two-component system OmpR family response regulator
MSKQCVLVVDDEENVAFLVASVLRLDGFEVHVAEDGKRALIAAEEHRPDLIILDVMLGGAAQNSPDGFEVLRRLRAGGSNVPVVFLTARDAGADRVAGLHAGADDYVVKPFSLEELLARVHAVLRRTTAGPGARGSVLKVGELELDEESREVRKGEREITLTATEFELLRLLMRNERVVLSKATILDRVWHYDFGGSMNIVEIYIGYLRKKVDTDEHKLIHTIRGAGYVLKAPRPAHTPTP